MTDRAPNSRARSASKNSSNVLGPPVKGDSPEFGIGTGRTWNAMVLHEPLMGEKGLRVGAVGGEQARTQGSDDRALAVDLRTTAAASRRPSGVAFRWVLHQRHNTRGHEARDTHRRAPACELSHLNDRATGRDLDSATCARGSYLEPLHASADIHRHLHPIASHPPIVALHRDSRTPAADDQEDRAPVR